ncbi:DNA polymerase III subunit delta' [Candidatus Parabeggiatoa sp. HSG14]|uniref:DNA polymerase III subunit delta' n=1 Tax=Candidatus Parabeggiatoa sp. HSG14 TaxID=3055593 RepID=UPI0025A70FEA|nr:DNA polymerase III subunit delta' [Thiotrichales bacterium HSG14]
MTTVLPWHNSLWQQVLRSKQQNRLPHALLLCGPQGMGKALFARRLIEMLLCEQPQTEGLPCGHCKPCHLLRAETHPDLLQVQPAETGKQIPIDIIRNTIQFCGMTAHYGRYQIVIVNPAEAMNRNAANSLLKLLEEPPSSTMLMLISHQPMALLATIRSRCQRLDFSRPDHQLTKTWLQSQLKNPALDAQLLLNLSAQAPLAALTLVETKGMAKRRELFESLIELPYGKNDPVRIAESWNKLEVAQVLQWMLGWTMDIIRYATTNQTQHFLNYDYKETLKRLAKQFYLHDLFDLLDLQQEVYQLVTGSANVKSQGLLESLAIAWVKLGTQHRR